MQALAESHQILTLEQELLTALLIFKGYTTAISILNPYPRITVPFVTKLCPQIGLVRCLGDPAHLRPAAPLAPFWTPLSEIQLTVTDITCKHKLNSYAWRETLLGPVSSFSDNSAFFSHGWAGSNRVIQPQALGLRGRACKQALPKAQPSELWWYWYGKYFELHRWHKIK